MFFTRITRFVTTSILILVLSVSCTTQKPVKLTVSSGAGLKNVMEAVQQAYLQDAPNVTINYNFAASGILRQQIEQGSPVDIALLASQQDIDALQSQHLLLDGVYKNLLKSEVVLIVPKNSTGISSFKDLTSKDIKRIAIGEPKTVPLGQYAEEIFQYFGIRDQVQSKLIYARSALEIMSYVDSGNVDAGIVHDTTIQPSHQVRIAAIAPPSSHTPVVYPIAILKNSHDPIAAKALIQFLSSDRAKAIFHQYGYGIISEH